MFALPLWFPVASLAILGAIWGSFVAALCSRWPEGTSVAKGGSRCDQCGAQIAVYDLIPVASYLLLKGRCRHCSHHIGLMSLATEIAAALIGAVSVLLFSGTQAIAVAVFGWLLLPLIILDHQHLWLPNRLVFLLALIGFVIGPILTTNISLVDRVAGLVAGFLSLEVVRQVYKHIRQREGMGAGDPKLFAALGIWLGWQALPIVLLGASAIGIISVSIIHMTANRPRMAFPLGSYLGVSAYFYVWIV